MSTQSRKPPANITPNELRQKYLDFFAKKIAQKHAVIPSASLIPENDPTTLFTSSGMQPLIPYLLGETHPMGKRLVDSQKSFRSQDIEEVGDNRHTTFFEMLGNWSLGDYFKKEQLRWFFTFLTQEVGLDPARLFVTVFRGNEALQIPRDQESVEIWQALFTEAGIDAKAVDFSDRDGMQSGRIFYYDEKKNWWSRSGVPANMPPGEPGGPDSEVFFDYGAERHFHEQSTWKNQPCHVNCDCGRFVEIGNSVFMQYQKQADGSFKELPQKNVDFGGGFERILAARQQENDVFKTALFWPLIQDLEKISRRAYTENEKTQAAMRVITDHMKAATFLIIDGVLPSNKGQGYLLRRLLRRAALKAHLLDMDFVKVLPELSAAVLDIYDGIHNVQRSQQGEIFTVIQDELQKFQRTLSAGLKILENTAQVDGKVAFDLYQSYGFPFELTTEILAQKGTQVNLESFQQEFEKHKQLSRSASAGQFKGGLADHSEATTRYHTATHLLHAALRQVIGTHVQQKGSNITAERMRFDFTHTAALTEAEKKAVSTLINDWIAADIPVTMQTLKKQDALNSGAIAFFIEKYPDEVTVYTIGKNPDGQQGKDWISKEFCGGPHVTSTGQIGPIELLKEQSASAGVRRVYVQTVPAH
jgi:alanyl-tRNA synthetase